MMNLQLPPHYCKTDVMRSVLVHADCFDVFPYIEDKSVNLILCDLPYGTTACKWDSVLPFDKLWKEYERIITDNGAIVLFGSQPFTSSLIMSNPKMFKYEIIWEKTRPTGFFTAKKMVMKIHENILVFYRKQCTYNPIMTEADPSKIDKRKTLNPTFNPYLNVTKERVKDTGFRYPTSISKFNSISQKGQHPTQKPIELIKMLVKTYSNEDDVVMDNCMGSNTTGLACKELNRQYIGIEKDKNYYDVSVSRVLS
jgi:DNA modification methylase